MKKLFLFLILAIGFVSCDWLDPINPPEVVKYTITATYDANVTISPASVVVEKGDSAILNVITKTGYKSTVKVNGTIVPLTSSKLTLSNVVADMKVEATSSLIVIKLKQFTLTAKSYGNGTITPEVVVVDSGKSATFTITPSSGYLVDVFKVNNTEVSLTSNVYTNPSVSSNDKLEVTFKKIKLKQFTLTAKSNGNGTITPEVVVVDSGKSATALYYNWLWQQIAPTFTFIITPKAGYMVDAFKVNDNVVPLTTIDVENAYGHGENVPVYTIPNVKSDKKLDVTFKEDLSPYFFNTKWRADSTYSRPIGGTYVGWGYAYPGERVIQFTSHGTYFWFYSGRDINAGGDDCHWSVDVTKKPVRLYMSGGEYKIEVLTEKKLILSHIQKGGILSDGTREPDYEFKETYIPEP